MSIDAIVAATGIPSVGEKWFKQGNLDMSYFEPYLKPRYKDHSKSIFPFSHVLDRYAPMMKIIMKYFSCEGRFSRLYSYHIRLLMHFTRVRMLHIPYYIFVALKKWPTYCKRETIISKCRAYSIIHSSIWLLSTISNRNKFHGIPSLIMRFSLLHMAIISKIFLHLLILPYPLLHHFLLFIHLHSFTFLQPMMTLPHHLSTTLHSHIMMTKHQAVMGTVRQMALK